MVFPILITFLSSLGAIITDEYLLIYPYTTGITAHCLLPAESGYWGCHFETAKPRRAYHFLLLEESAKIGEAFYPNQFYSLSWKLVDEKSQNHPTVQFSVKKPGNYLLVCYAGESRGCPLHTVHGEVKGRSLIYRRFWGRFSWIKQE